MDIHRIHMSQDRDVGLQLRIGAGLDILRADGAGGLGKGLCTSAKAVAVHICDSI